LLASATHLTGREVRKTEDERLANACTQIAAPWPGITKQAVLIPRRECPSVPKSQKIVDLALSPAMILDRECIDAGIDANIANKEIGTLDKVRYLVTGSLAETTCGIRHRTLRSCPCRAAYLASGRYAASVLIRQHECPNQESTRRSYWHFRPLARLDVPL
jgi:hypothetical protein